ncbi:MAG: hypothetical protein ACRDRJ_46125 [Streptosporangiaceae bacterium]
MRSTSSTWLAGRQDQASTEDQIAERYGHFIARYAAADPGLA